MHDFRTQLNSLQASHREAEDRLNEKSKQLILTKAEVEKISKQNASMAEEVRLKASTFYLLILLLTISKYPFLRDPVIPVSPLRPHSP